MIQLSLHTISEMLQILKGIEFSISVLVVLNILLVIGFGIIAVFAFAKIINQQEKDLNEIHAKAKKYFEDESTDSHSKPIEELNHSIIRVEYENHPEEWEYIWYALSKHNLNHGLNVHFASATGDSWEYLYTILSESPIHIFYHPNHPITSNQCWTVIPAKAISA